MNYCAYSQQLFGDDTLNFMNRYGQVYSCKDRLEWRLRGIKESLATPYYDENHAIKSKMYGTMDSILRGDTRLTNNLVKP